MLFEIIISFLLIILLSVVSYYKKSFSYWKNKKVPFVTPKFPFGNLSNPFTTKRHLFFDVQDVYKKFKEEGYKYGGFYVMSASNLLVMDPDHIKHIFTKDFHVFMNRSIRYEDKDDPLSNHLFSMNGDKWKLLRSKLTPTFTSGRIKMMFKTLLDCSAPLMEEITKLSNANQPLDIKELLASFMTDVIGSCAFGIECNSFKNQDAGLRKFGRETLNFSFLMGLKRMVFSVSPKLAKLLGLKKHNAEETHYFRSVTENTVTFREKNNITRPDFMQLLIQLKNGPEKLTMEEIASQCFLFFVAGFETSSTLLTFCTYELAKHQDLQDRLRKEINENLPKYKGEITYEGLKEMEYLDQVIDETLRKYPPLAILNRVCMQDYRLPNSGLVLEKGTNVLISNYALQHDPEYYPEPEKFDPDRFAKANKHKLIPYTFLPFGEGPRNCIGLRFGLVQAKMCLVSILKSFKLRPCENTPVNIRFESNTITLSSVDTIYLCAEKLA